MISHKTLFLFIGLTLSATASTDEASKQDSVFMFSQTYCPVCLHAKQFLNKEGISFTELNIEEDPKALAAFKRIKGRGTPLFVVNKKMIYGFKPELIKAHLYSQSHMPIRE